MSTVAQRGTDQMNITAVLCICCLHANHSLSSSISECNTGVPLKLPAVFAAYHIVHLYQELSFQVHAATGRQLTSLCS